MGQKKRKIKIADLFKILFFYSKVPPFKLIFYFLYVLTDILLKKRETLLSNVMQYHNPVLPQNICIILSDCFPVSAISFYTKEHNGKPEKRQVSVFQIMYTYNKTICILAYFRITDAEKPQHEDKNILLFYSNDLINKYDKV
jgi:hypothetical protein